MAQPRTSSSEHLCGVLLPYQDTTPEQRGQAAAHTQHLLCQRLIWLTHDDWLTLLDESKPALYVAEAARMAAVDETALATLTSRALIYQAVQYEYPEQAEDDPGQLAFEVNYLARRLLAYIYQASVLLVADPDLTRPLSVDQMRDIIRRLAVRNAIAEKLAAMSPVTEGPSARPRRIGLTRKRMSHGQ